MFGLQINLKLIIIFSSLEFQIFDYRLSNRYRILILGEDSTEACNFVLNKSSCKEVDWIQCNKTHCKYAMTPNVFLTKIKDICDRDLKLKLLISEDNINSSGRLFFATDAYEAGIATPTMSEATVGAYGNSENSESNVAHLADTGNSPDTSHTTFSTSKKIKICITIFLFGCLYI